MDTKAFFDKVKKFIDPSIIGLSLHNGEPATLIGTVICVAQNKTISQRRAGVHVTDESDPKEVVSELLLKLYGPPTTSQPAPKPKPPIFDSTGRRLN